MMRSEINLAILEGLAFINQQGFILPPFAKWFREDWQAIGAEASEIVQRGLGWDVTDFGLGHFRFQGVLLFTIRNGTLENLKAGKGKAYCEKVLVCRPNQVVMHHFHKQKTEDIINRAGGTLELILQYVNQNGQPLETEVEVVRDGIKRTVPASGTVLLEPGESITLEPYMMHQFQALQETVLVGEVSSVNDDHNDNFFLEPVGRFPKIVEDVNPLQIVIGDYAEYCRSELLVAAGLLEAQ